MAGAHHSRAVGVVIAAAVISVGVGVGSPAAVAAADEAAVSLPGSTHSAVTADIDGDGSREVLRIAAEPGVGVIVEAWAYGPEGWGRTGSADLLRKDEAGDMVPLRLGFDAAGLLRWRADGRERVLALTATRDPTLSIAEVRLEAQDLELHPLPATSSEGSFDSVVQAVDLEADGTDELVLVSFAGAASPAGPLQRLEILRWTGSAFEAVFEREDAGGLAFLAGDSDGLPGDEVLLGVTAAGRLERIAWGDGEPLSEVTDLGLGSFDGWVVGAADGAIVLALSNGIRVLRWARGEDATEAGRVESVMFPNAYLVGSGPEALILVSDGDALSRGEAPVASVYDLALRPLGKVERAPTSEQLWSIAEREMTDGFQAIFPYVGPVPGGWTDGRPAAVASGVLIRSGGSGGFETRPIAPLAGVQPIGLAGPNGEWMAMGNPFLFGPWQQTHLYAGPGPFEAGGLTLARVVDLLRPDDEASIASLALRNAVEFGTAVNAVQPLAAEGDGFEVVVTAASGSRVFLVDSYRSRHYDVRDEPLVVEVRPPRRVQANMDWPLEMSLVVVTPEGRASTASWEGRFVRQPPQLSVSASTETLALRARLEGRASPGVTLTANGRGVETDADGRFAIAIDAPIWPSAVVMTARDPLGNETTDLVEVVGFIDYRGWPWPGLVVFATIAAGAVLFIRVPRAHPASGRLAGDARLEEMELDAADVDVQGRAH